ncbi:ComEA family DNA-binding protein [Arenibacter echinorum]|uniref:DNA uptake protein ComE-like DNA-binding protein n=1 Tax=Arenibacter echinorum TaxID=440515 RepID=A0A327QNN8_9FLAO|nr:helix-hairpin-helix domain-containing protein [Arenibacter echinorum]RAJ06199.1 DNA uptake protein ComE-like DNA-binding protein [Arenibacter echinorum]
MNRKSFKSHFKFNKQERSGIFFLLFLIVIFQTVYFVVKSYPISEKANSLTVDKEYQAKIDELRSRNQKKDSISVYPFNPNFITDYKGYILGMSTEEIERLHVFRAKNQFVNSAKEFQKVTLISDSLLESLQSYFKFPEWTRRGSIESAYGGSRTFNSVESKSVPDTFKSVKIKDINRVTAEELRSVNGIGEKLSQRIVKFRDLLGGFLSEEQLGHVYGLDPEVVARVLKDYRILESPDISKININQASPWDISKLVYIKYEVAARIVALREANGGIASFDELIEIEDFPSEKLDIIKLYLQL